MARQQGPWPGGGSGCMKRRPREHASQVHSPATQVCRAAYLGGQRLCPCWHPTSSSAPLVHAQLPHQQSSAHEANPPVSRSQNLQYMT